MQNIAGVHGILGGDGVVAEEPQNDGQEKENQGLYLVHGQLAAACGLLLLPSLLLNAQGHGLLLHFVGPLLFPDGEHENHQRRQHDGRNDGEIAGVAHQGVADGGGGEHHAQSQHQNAAGRAHEVDDGVGLGAQRLQGHVGHQGHRRGPEHGHRNQDDQQQNDEEYQGGGTFGGGVPGAGLAGGDHIVGIIGVGDGLAVLLHLAADPDEFLLGELLAQDELVAAGGQQRLVGLAVVDLLQGGGVVNGGDIGQVPQLGAVHKGQGDEHHGGDEGTHHDEGGAAAPLAPVLVGNGAEQGQHEQGQHVVQGHDDAGPCLAHAEFVGEDQGDGVVIGLPERADQEEGKAHENSPLVVEFHTVSSSFRYRVPMSGYTQVGWI